MEKPTSKEAVRRSSALESHRETETCGAGMVRFRELLQDELARVEAILTKLESRKRVALDLTADDLWQLFEEEHRRLAKQLGRVDAALTNNEVGFIDPFAYCQYLRLRRRAFAATTSFNFK